MGYGELYANYVEEIAARVDSATVFLLEGSNWPRVRAAAQELRGALEMLLFAGLITHRELLQATEAAIVGANRKEARRLVRRANPDWWPMAVLQLPSARPGIKKEIVRAPEGDWLTEDEWDGAWSRTSDLLHVRNPYTASRQGAGDAQLKLFDLANRLIGLLDAHVVTLGNTTWLCQVGPTEQLPRVTVTVFDHAPV